MKRAVEKKRANADIYRCYSATTFGAFGVVAGVFVLQMFADVPKIRTDICQVRLIKQTMLLLLYAEETC